MICVWIVSISSHLYFRMKRCQEPFRFLVTALPSFNSCSTQEKSFILFPFFLGEIAGRKHYDCNQYWNDPGSHNQRKHQSRKIRMQIAQSVAVIPCPDSSLLQTSSVSKIPGIRKPPEELPYALYGYSHEGWKLLWQKKEELCCPELEHLPLCSPGRMQSRFPPRFCGLSKCSRRDCSLRQWK